MGPKFSLGGPEYKTVRHRSASGLQPCALKFQGIFIEREQKFQYFLVSRFELLDESIFWVTLSHAIIILTLFCLILKFKEEKIWVLDHLNYSKGEI